ncbi:hypothetical protein SERLA73DRAFT_176503 [Serpula lacrymans var. lacrymans S7.3]|uniref:Uncharacterized protein n=2 Tax=Serpula lacrymans var. lacrymans TaxID=341189 RepID=F8PN32_SERL3|nr:uncharacterized protein SERLADRAFT_459386 [Serpula lacrymans var. lacrymans S7.9]EGO03014.1 hypothetical protein SERLA73DRAFT_176503 [Serpula lacrymans var. lacrymans S7.3]EGO28692.1 hypothetical protein SERLADRAFT_459386 [Serpula lacrymans var. lacrymans S7.9]
MFLFQPSAPRQQFGDSSIIHLQSGIQSPQIITIIADQNIHPKSNWVTETDSEAFSAALV